MLIFGSIAATGAGLHVAAYYIGHEAHIGATATVLTVAVPVAVFVLTLFALYTYLVRAVDPFHIALLAGTAALLVLPVMLATLGAPMAVCLVVLMLAPLVPVIGYETSDTGTWPSQSSAPSPAASKLSDRCGHA